MVGAVRVGVFGAGGRMGVAVCRAVDAASGLDLVAAVDPALVGTEVERRDSAPLTVSAEPEELA
ncbi:MAG: hypothetical protein ACRD1G_10870, partial [Acidimicrobiales bacterium]